MPRVTEFTPLLVHDDDNLRPPRRRRSVWQFVLAGALSLGLLSLFKQENDNGPSPLNAAVSFDETSPQVGGDADDVAFLSSMETFKDPSVDPCVDFYQYACGGWLKIHKIPSDRPSIDSSFYVVSETNKDTIQKVIDANPPQIGQLYHSCLNAQEVDPSAVTFVSQLLENVHKADSTLALLEYAGELDQSLGISSFFSLFVGADPEDPTTNVLQLAQGGLTLPSREYYLEQSKVDAYATLYVDYVTKLFAVGDLDKHNVSEYAQAVLDTETAFAKISLSNAALRNLWTTNTAYPFAEIAARYPFLMAYLNGINKLEPFPMLHAIVATPDFFEAQNELFKDESLLPQLKNYLSFHLIDSFGAVLGEYFRRASHEFHGTIQGAGALLPRDQFCVRLTTTFLGDELGEYYMKDVFGPDAKAAAQALVAEIEESLKALLMTESWLDKVTYDAAVDKLNKVKNYIGGPDDVPPLPFELQADAFFNNVKSLMQLSAAATIRAIGGPVDEEAWDMFPSTVNAYYDPSANKMVFPAAILQPPFYSAEHFPAAANFARIGMVMGHELSHGFDDQGRNYDGNGALRSWWTPSVSAEFSEKAQCLAAQYSAFPVVSIGDGHVLGPVNGNLTLGENIADNGGIHLAYEAYHLWRSTFAPSPPPETPSPATEVPQQTPKPVETAPAPEPEAGEPPRAPEPTPAPADVSPPDEQAPEPSQPNPNEDIPDVTPAPVIPIPNEPAPEPSETGPGEQIPEVTLPPPVLPVPDAVTPKPAQTGPSGDIPVATPSPPPVVPEPQPADTGPGEVIPDGISPTTVPPAPENQTPAPTEPATEAPVVTPPPPPPPTKPTPAPIPDVPTPPTVPVVPTPPVVPDVPHPAATEVPTDKHKHMKEKEEPTEPEEKEHDDKQKHRKGEDKKIDKSGSDEDDSRSSSGHKKASGKHGDKKEEERGEQKPREGKHSDEQHEDKDEDDKSSKREHSTKHDKESEGEGDEHGKHHSHYGGSKDEESTTKHKKHDEGGDNKRKSESHHHKEQGDEDSDRDKSDRKHRHEKVDEDDHEKHERREGRHRRDEEKEEDNDRHEGKHHGRGEHDGRKEEEQSDSHGKREHRWEDDDGNSGRHEHHEHESKEERREERKERKEHKKEEKEADRHGKGKHLHNSDEDNDDEDESKYHEKHHEKKDEKKHHRHEEECGDCEGKKHERHHHKHEEEWERHGCGNHDDGCASKRHEWALSESKYPFSGGDLKIRSMVETLARAIVQSNDPVADDRLFFTAFAQNWCEKRTPGYAELLRTIDPHSPGKWRVNGPLMNYDKFAEAFSCPVGTPMNPENKCVIW